MSQIGFFDWQRRFEQLDKGGDPLVKLNEVVSCQACSVGCFVCHSGSL